MPSLYILKALCAFFVVIIHSHIFGKSFFAPVIWSAVPCFYMCTGFFLHSNSLKEETSKLKKWINKAILLLVAINFLYLAVEFLRDNREILWYEWPLSILNGGIITVHLWYLSSLWQGLIVLWLLLKTSRKLLILGPLLYIVVYGLNPILFHVDLGHYCTWQEHLMSVSRALCFLCLGYLISYKNYKTSCSILWDICLFAVVFILMKIRPCSNAAFYVVCTIIESASLFTISLKATHIRMPWFEWIGKYHSANIYFFHALFVTAYRIASFHYPPIRIYESWSAIPLFIISLTFSVFVNAAKNYIVMNLAQRK